MDGQKPEFKEADPRWIRADALRSQLGIKHAQFQRIHRSFGVPFEYRGDGKPGTPVWVYFPGWFEARIRFESSPADAPTEVNQDDRLKRIKANREELRYQKDLEVLLHVRDSLSDMDFLGGILSKAITQLEPKCQAVMLAAIDEAENEWIRRYGDGLQHADTQTNGQASGVDTPDSGGPSMPPTNTS